MEFLQQNYWLVALAAASGIWLIVELIRGWGDKSRLSPLEATLKVNREDGMFIDVRDKSAFDKAHLPGARHYALTDLSRRLSELEKFRATPLIFYCNNGSNAAKAVATLKKANFEKIFSLHGGLLEWERGGQPLSRGKK